MDTLIRFVGLVVAMASIFQAEGDKFLQILLRDIPAEALSRVAPEESLSDIQSIVDERRVRMAQGATLCRPACLDAAKSLSAICERHVLAEAPMSLAVCYGRIDEDRARCVDACGK